MNECPAYLIVVASGPVSGSDDRDGVCDPLLVRLLFLGLLKEPTAHSSSEELSSEEPRINLERGGFLMFVRLGSGTLPFEGANFNCFCSGFVEGDGTTGGKAGPTFCSGLLPVCVLEHSSGTDGPAASSCCKVSVHNLSVSMTVSCVLEHNLYFLHPKP